MATALKDVKFGEFVLKGTTVDGSVEYVIGTDEVIRDNNDHLVAHVNCDGIWAWGGIADCASRASRADCASFADCAGSACTADCAGYATYSGSAGSACFADCAGYATYAGSADFAGGAGTADCAGYADCAGAAGFAFEAASTTTVSGYQCYGTSSLWWSGDSEELYGYFASGSTTGPIRVSSVGSLPAGALVLYLQP